MCIVATQFPRNDIKGAGTPNFVICFRSAGDATPHQNPTEAEARRSLEVFVPFLDARVNIAKEKLTENELLSCVFRDFVSVALHRAGMQKAHESSYFFDVVAP